MSNLNPQFSITNKRYNKIISHSSSYYNIEGSDAKKGYLPMKASIRIVLYAANPIF